MQVEEQDFFPEIDRILATYGITKQKSDVEILWHVIIDLNVLIIFFLVSIDFIDTQHFFHIFLKFWFMLNNYNSLVFWIV